MSDLHQDLIRINQQTGNARAIANPRQMRATQTVEGAFDGSGRLRVDALPRHTPAEWDGDHPVWGPAHIWVAPSDRTVRMKWGAPASETDGVVVATL